MNRQISGSVCQWRCSLHVDSITIFSSELLSCSCNRLYRLQLTDIFSASSVLHVLWLSIIQVLCQIPKYVITTWPCTDSLYKVFRWEIFLATVSWESKARCSVTWTWETNSTRWSRCPCTKTFAVPMGSTFGTWRLSRLRSQCKNTAASVYCSTCVVFSS